MSQHTKSTPNALREHFEAPNGRPISALLRESKQKLSNHRAESVMALQKHLAEIDVLATKTGNASAEKDRLALRNAAEDLTSIAAFAGKPLLGEVTRCLFAICQEMVSANQWNQAYIDLHMAALKQARAADDTPAGKAELAALVEGLNALRAKFAARS